MVRSVVYLSILCFIPAFAVWMAALLASRRGRMGMPAEQVLYRLGRFVRYFHTLYLLIFVECSLRLGYELLQHVRPVWVARNLIILFAVVCFLLLKMFYTATSYSPCKKLLGFEMTPWSAVWRTGYGNLPKALFFGGLTAVLDALNQQWLQSHQWFVSMAITLVFFVTMLVLTELGPWFMRCRKMPMDQVPAAWAEIARQAGFPATRFYQWRTRKTKILNAMATGLIRPKVVVADYLVDTLSAEHVNAIIRHEMGHLRKRHLWWGTIGILAWIPLAQGFRSLMMLMHVPVGIIGLLGWVGLGAYLGLVMKGMSRRFEYQADAYAAQFGTDAKIGALTELAQHSRSVYSVSWFDELWMTHPSIEHRISRLRQMRLPSATVTASV